MYYLEHNTLYNNHFISPKIPYAEFSGELTQHHIREMVNDLNYGKEMLTLYSSFRHNLDIESTVYLLKEMKKIHDKWQYSNYIGSKEIT